MRGSIRKVIVTDSADSAPDATEESINLAETEFSDQNDPSASSLSKIGTSSQLLTNAICSDHFSNSTIG
jgi:hypothetical protein